MQFESVCRALDHGGGKGVASEICTLVLLLAVQMAGMSA
jgi:hypothetical protein